MKTMRLAPLIAAVLLATTSCQQQPEGSSNNAVTAAETNAVNASASDVANAAAAVAGGVPTGGVCGGVANAQCASGGDFCKKATGQCDVADAQGTCTTRPEICTQQYDPVCGCDGKTYGNACEADAAGMSIRSEGECPTP